MYGCMYSPLNRYINFYYGIPTILLMYVCMYVCIVGLDNEINNLTLQCVRPVAEVRPLKIVTGLKRRRSRVRSLTCEATVCLSNNYF